MSNYQIEITKTAEKQLKSLPLEYKIKLTKSINLLAVEPRPHGSKKLTGYENSYRIRVGNYRIIYDIKDKVLTILILKIGHRKDIYR